MKVHVCVTTEDLDKQTVRVEEQRVVSEQIEDTNTMQFTDREVTVPVASISQLVFRQIDQEKNPSNKIMVCTGILVDGTWYGDRPDDGTYKNPFTNETVTVGTPTPEEAKFLYKENWQGNTIELVRWQGKTPELKVFSAGGINGNNNVLVPSQVIDTTLNGEPAKTYIYDLGSASVRSKETEHLDWELNGQHYATNNLPRLSVDNQLGVFGYTDTSSDEIIKHMPRYVADHNFDLDEVETDD